MALPVKMTKLKKQCVCVFELTWSFLPYSHPPVLESQKPGAQLLVRKSFSRLVEICQALLSDLPAELVLPVNFVILKIKVSVSI